jgi:acetoin utilization protein AcuB
MKHYEIPAMNDCMTLKPISIRPDESVAKALGLMLNHGIRHLPVVDGDQLVGILSDRDIGRGGTTEAEPIVYGDIDLQQPVSKVMSGRPISVGEETLVPQAIKQMVEHRIGSLPVVDSYNKLVGIFTETDALQFCLRLIERY